MRRCPLYIKNIATTAGCTLAVFVASAVPVMGASQSSGALAQGFRADSGKGDIVTGALVSSKIGDPKSVELATANTVNRLVGVADSSSLVVISSSARETQVVLSGTTNVLVSDINGAVRVSDKITVSPINGVGMRATADSQIAGTAQADFDTASAQEQTITDKDGKDHRVRVGYIPLQVGVAFYRAPGSDFLPPFVQSIANTIAGRPVSAIRILLCGALLLIGFISIAVLIYSSVRSAMTSLGRNPLAADAIRKSLYQVIAVALVVLGGTLMACYIILAA